MSGAELAEIQGMRSRLRTLRDGHDGELRHAFTWRPIGLPYWSRSCAWQGSRPWAPP